MSAETENKPQPEPLTEESTTAPENTEELQSPSKAAPAPKVNNPFNMDENHLHLLRFGEPGDAAEDECALQLEAIEDREGAQYRNTLCPLAPEDARKEQLLDVGTDYDTVAEVTRQFEEALKHTEAFREQFGGTMNEFFCWRRWKDLNPNAVLFDPKEGDPVERHHQPPTTLPTQPNFQSFMPVFERGVLDDHFFLLTFCAVANNKALLESVFASTQHVDRGMLSYRFFDDKGNADFVTVDTLVPCTKDILVGQPQMALGRTLNRDEFWLAFLVKAYATFRGSYAHLHGGDAPSVLRHMTGCDLQGLTWNPEKVNPWGQMEVWWVLLEAMRLNQPVIATSRRRCSTLMDYDMGIAVEDNDVHKIDFMASKMNWSYGAVVHFALDYDKSLEKTDYANIREKRLDPDIFNVMKVRLVYPEQAKELQSQCKSWGPDSMRWNEKSRATLNNPEGINNECCVWLTVQEFTEHFDSVVMVNNIGDETESITRFSNMPRLKMEEIASRAPHFLLGIRKADDVAGEDGTWAEGIDCNFDSIFDLKPNPIDLGEETDDESEPGGTASSRTSVVSGASQRSSMVDVQFTSPNALIMEFDITIPPTHEFPPEFEILAFRVPKAERQIPVQSIQDGKLVSTLPVHSRVQITEMDSGSKTAFKFELEANTGFYNLVIAPKRNLDVPTQFSISSLKRQNGENYNVEFYELP